MSENPQMEFEQHKSDSLTHELTVIEKFVLGLVLAAVIWIVYKLVRSATKKIGTPRLDLPTDPNLVAPSLSVEEVASMLQL